MKIGRNHPCACGSGKKYKQCCGRPEAKAATRAAIREPNEQKFERAMDWINERLCEDGVPFPDRPEAAVRLMGQVTRTGLSYPVPDREPDSFQGEDLAIRSCRRTAFPRGAGARSGGSRSPGSLRPVRHR